jgi:hypothetical protein
LRLMYKISTNFVYLKKMVTFVTDFGAFNAEFVWVSTF